ncbi:hypothetical protein C1H46_005494 [Malus baccata]|uniref:Uncharacterized protein n=1 Tax=Malus baccata TaxID=106549 RepID=A0A540NED7_MALBA|nr:hypothetical protein C1H46_005494 [Malus baccata]
MAKQELEKEEKNNGTRERPNKKEVIITVYVESPASSDSHQKPGPVKKINPKPSSEKPHQTAKTRIYDRRAQLLAYSQELRTTGDAQKVQWTNNGSKPKPRRKLRCVLRGISGLLCNKGSKVAERNYHAI